MAWLRSLPPLVRNLIILAIAAVLTAVTVFLIAAAVPGPTQKRIGVPGAMNEESTSRWGGHGTAAIVPTP